MKGEGEEAVDPMAREPQEPTLLTNDDATAPPPALIRAGLETLPAAAIAAAGASLGRTLICSECDPHAAHGRLRKSEAQSQIDSNPYPLDLIERNLVLSAVVKLGGTRRLVRRDLLCVLQRSAVLKVGGDTGGSKCVTASGVGQGGAGAVHGSYGGLQCSPPTMSNSQGSTNDF